MINIVDLVKKFFKLFTKTQWIILISIVGLYFLSRLTRLDGFPIFSDEGIYIRWAKVAWKDASWRFISLTDGRQPLQTWATIPFLKIFETNALVAGRLFAVSSGFVSLVGILTVSRYLFGAPSALIAGFLYVVTPYFLFYDRIALVDSAVNASTIWMFFLSIVLARTRRLDIAMILGVVSGLALLAKSSLRLYLGLSALAVIFIIFSDPESTLRSYIASLKSIFMRSAEKRQKIQEVISFYALYIVSAVFAVLIYNIQRLSPFMHFVEEKNKTFILTKAELLADPFNYFSHNIVNMPYYIFSETAYVVAFLGIVGLYVMYKKHKQEAIYFTMWLVTAMLSISLVARVLFPRYVLSLGGLLILPAAYFISEIKSIKYRNLTILCILLSVAYFNYTIIFEYAKIPFPSVDRGQYLEGWPAGWGAKEIMMYAREQSLSKPVLIIAEGNFGMSHDVLDTFMKPGDRISIQPYWPLDKEQLIENQKNIGAQDVYVVFAHRREFPSDWPIELVKQYDKPGNESELFLFRLLPAIALPSNQ